MVSTKSMKRMKAATSKSTSPAPKAFSWKKTDVDLFLDWLEANQDALRGTSRGFKSAWVKDCKEQVFANDPGVTVERISVKHSNMKASWTAARKELGSAEGGVKTEGTGLDGEFEKKYPLYQRLDAIFSALANASPKNTPTSNPTPRRATSEKNLNSTEQQANPQEAPNPAQPQANPEAHNLLDDHDMEDPHLSDDSEGDSEYQSEGSVYAGEDNEAAGAGGNSDEDFDPETSPPPPPPPPKPQAKRRRRSSGGTSARGKSRIDSVKRMMEEERQSYELERELKRVKIEQEMQKERLEAKERLARINASTTTEVAKIQAEAHVRQFELLTQILRQQAGSAGPHTGGAAGGGSTSANARGNAN